jgi:hypothetical protein
MSKKWVYHEQENPNILWQASYIENELHDMCHEFRNNKIYRFYVALQHMEIDICKHLYCCS